MLISCDPMLPGYVQWLLLVKDGLIRDMKVMLDGVDVTKVAVSADDERGRVVVLKKVDGRFVMSATEPKIQREIRYGKVRIDVPKVYDAVPSLGGRKR